VRGIACRKAAFPHPPTQSLLLLCRGMAGLLQADHCTYPAYALPSALHAHAAGRVHVPAVIHHPVRDLGEGVAHCRGQGHRLSGPQRAQERERERE
jgi:hypothetical protein